MLAGLLPYSLLVVREDPTDGRLWGGIGTVDYLQALKAFLLGSAQLVSKDCAEPLTRVRSIINSGVQSGAPQLFNIRYI